MMGGEGQIYVHDVDPRRLKQLDGAAQRAGAGHMLQHLTQFDKETGGQGAAGVGEEWGEMVRQRGGADVVLVDAPCSSSGVLRRHPSLRWTLSQTEVRPLWERRRGLQRSLVCVPPS